MIGSKEDLAKELDKIGTILMLTSGESAPDAVANLLAACRQANAENKELREKLRTAEIGEQWARTFALLGHNCPPTDVADQWEAAARSLREEMNSTLRKLQREISEHEKTKNIWGACERERDMFQERWEREKKEVDKLRLSMAKAAGMKEDS